MKQLTNTALALLALCMLNSCDRDIVDETPVNTDLGNFASVKVYNASPSTLRNFFYVDGNALNTATLAFNSSYPAPTGTYGALLAPGSHTFLVKDTLAAATQPPLTFTGNLVAGKNYTIYLYDTVSAMKQIVVETPLPAASDTAPKVRLAHFAFLKGVNAPAIDVFSKNKNANIFTNVPYGQVTNFINYTSGISDSLIVRETGSTTNNLDTAVFTPTVKRAYTLIFGQRYMTNGTGGATLPRTLTVTTNY
jgi:hypothetical protein